MRSLFAAFITHEGVFLRFVRDFTFLNDFDDLLFFVFDLVYEREEYFLLFLLICIYKYIFILFK